VTTVGTPKGITSIKEIKQRTVQMWPRYEHWV